MTRERLELLSEQAAGARPGRGRAALCRGPSVRPSIREAQAGPSVEVVPANLSADGATRKPLHKPTEPHAAPS